MVFRVERFGVLILVVLMELFISRLLLISVVYVS